MFNYGEFIPTGDSVPAARPLKQTFLRVYASAEGVGIVVSRIVRGSGQRVRCDVVTALSRETSLSAVPPITLFLTQRWHRAPRKHVPTFATSFRTLL